MRKSVPMSADPRVLADPFFGVVARRHPDATIVLLPPRAAEPAEEDAGLERLTEPDFRARSDADLTALDEWLGSVLAGHDVEIGRASCRERVWQYVSIQVGAVSLKKTKKQK